MINDFYSPPPPLRVVEVMGINKSRLLSWAFTGRNKIFHIHMVRKSKFHSAREVQTKMHKEEQMKTRKDKRRFTTGPKNATFFPPVAVFAAANEGTL
jgi:hypothetical protein